MRRTYTRGMILFSNCARLSRLWVGIWHVIVSLPGHTCFLFFILSLLYESKSIHLTNTETYFERLTSWSLWGILCALWSCYVMILCICINKYYMIYRTNSKAIFTNFKKINKYCLSEKRQKITVTFNWDVIIMSFLLRDSTERRHRSDTV